MSSNDFLFLRRRTLVAAAATLIAGLLLLSESNALAAGGPQRQVVAGGYYSYYRNQVDERGYPLRNTPRFVQIQVLKLGIKITSYSNGVLQGSRFLVRKCSGQDLKLGSYVEDFESVPGDGPRETVKFVFRDNKDGNYDVYYQQPNKPLQSEILQLAQ